jgi:hypothetical protein
MFARGLRYLFDAERLMFSSGNVTEKARMGRVARSPSAPPLPSDPAEALDALQRRNDELG